MSTATENKNTEEKEESFLKKNIVPICSIIISTSALLFTVWQSQKIREHNKLSVLTQIQIKQTAYPDKNFEIDFKNAGIGPAVIDDIVLKTKDNKNYKVSELGGEFWRKVCNTASISDTVINKHLTFSVLNPGQFLPSKESLNFFGIVAKDLSADEYANTMNILSEATIYVDYHSVYEKQFRDSVVFDKFDGTDLLDNN